MRVFLCWSGERSKALAKALHDWLPLVLHYVKPWMSERDIEAGERWATHLATELDGATFGILCLTRDNLTQPWILFEAGAISKSLDSGKVVPLLLDLEMKDITLPLAQFQAKKCDKSEIRELVASINNHCSSGVQEGIWMRHFENYWTDLETNLGKIPKSTSRSPARKESDVLEDLVRAVRKLEARIDALYLPRESEALPEQALAKANTVLAFVRASGLPNTIETIASQLYVEVSTNRIGSAVRRIRDLYEAIRSEGDSQEYAQILGVMKDLDMALRQIEDERQRTRRTYLGDR